MQSIVSCSLVHISQDTFILARLQEVHTYVRMMQIYINQTLPIHSALYPYDRLYHNVVLYVQTAI